jgi:putative transposase
MSHLFIDQLQAAAVSRRLEDKMARTNTNWDVVKLFQEMSENIDYKKHFNPEEVGLTMKEVAKVRYTRSCKYNINYHFVWIPKTRMKILVNPFSVDVENSLLDICNEEGFFPLALQIMPDHIHFFVSAPPKFAPCVIIQKLKANSSKMIRKKYSIIRQTRKTDDFWASGYYVGTAGHISATQVARYIIEQTKILEKKWSLFDVKPFEYDINEEVEPNKQQMTLSSYGA